MVSFKKTGIQNYKRWSCVETELSNLANKSKLNRETMIVFIYDTECLKDEADDPVSAVLYFHPSWVSDTQKVALCGQLMGTSYFLKDCFFKPHIVALQNGKFVLKEFGRFTLAVGTDRNISDFLLQNRADVLMSLVKFFHRDLQSIYDQFAQQAQYKNLSEKLYHIFETYLPILQRNGNIFQNVPKLRIPKTASNIFLEAIQTLQCCQQTKGVLGGAILYHNKVVVSQLSDNVTKQIVLTDPLHIRTTAEQLNAQDFHIPNGVQMLVVYIDVQQYRKLSADAQRAQNLQTTNLAQGALSFQYTKRKMKRDKSLIFTHIPEEGSSNSETLQDAQQLEAPTRPKSLRPTHLPLRLKSLNNKELPESGIASINFDETDSYPEFIGRTSVCSTPMAENKVLQVGNIMSICANPEDENNSNSQTSHQNWRNSNLKLDFEKFFHIFLRNPNKELTRRKSFTDLQDSLKKISKKLSLKQISNSIKTDVNRNGGGNNIVETPDFIENDDDSSSDSSSMAASKSSRTITDPTYPVFNAQGQPISRSLFQEFLDKYNKVWGEAQLQAQEDAEIAAFVEEFREFEHELKKLDEYMRQEVTTNEIQADRNLNIAVKTPMDKKGMSLPLKPLGDISVAGESSTITSTRRKQPTGGVPLTPLMAKLCVLALNDATPGPGSIEIQTPLNATKIFPRRSSFKCDDAVDALAALSNVPAPGAATDGMQRTELYICGQQNMTLILLMEEGVAKQQPVVQKLFDVCVAKFPHMESHLNQSLNINVEGDKRESGYSFMCIDAKRDALERHGPWSPVELTTLECMHRDLVQRGGELTDLILRSYDNVFYAHKSGRSEFFYKEPTHQVNGIPPPSDPLGNIAMRAKMRLERDHSYMLF